MSKTLVFTHEKLGNFDATGSVPRPFKLIQLWLARVDGRRMLAELSPEQMKDVGLDPVTVMRECRKPFWKV